MKPKHPLLPMTEPSVPAFNNAKLLPIRVHHAWHRFDSGMKGASQHRGCRPRQNEAEFDAALATDGRRILIDVDTGARDDGFARLVVNSPHSEAVVASIGPERW